MKGLPPNLSLLAARMHVSEFSADLAVPKAIKQRNYLTATTEST